MTLACVALSGDGPDVTEAQLLRLLPRAKYLSRMLVPEVSRPMQLTPGTSAYDATPTPKAVTHFELLVAADESREAQVEGFHDELAGLGMGVVDVMLRRGQL